jgi:hypothetical protein
MQTNKGFSPSDTLSVLTHARNRVTKTWNADGTISPFDDAKYYGVQRLVVADIEELSSELTDLAADPRSCLIRGTPVPLDTQAIRDAAQFQPGKVRKALDYFDDQPLHAVMIDVDGYHGFAHDPATHTAEAIQEFIECELPPAWHGAAYHWHLSSSFGHPSKADTGLRVHLWFWLARPLTSAQLKAFAQATALPADVSLFHPVQAHFTADPHLAPGVVDPVVNRSGFVHGRAQVHLDVSDAVLTAASNATGAGQLLLDIASDDPVAQRLLERGLVKSKTRDGYNIECPFDDEHSGPSAESATQYRLPHTNGHSTGQFICLHAHCAERTRMAFMVELGLVNTIDDFEDCSGHAEVIEAAAVAVVAEKAKADRFAVESAAEFIVRRKASWLIKGVLPRANFGVFYGASGSGKSFFVFDMAAAVSRGLPWRGHRTAKARVLWIAAEGQEDMRKRVLGYCMHHGLDPAELEMQFISNAPNLMELVDVKALVKQILAAAAVGGGGFDLIVIDTLAQVMPGGNENSGEDMGKVMGHCKEITRLTGAMVAPVHHSGKDESRGARGWSGLRAACDFEFEVIRVGEDRCATVTKMKGGADGAEFGFRLETITVGKDEDGDDETTCVMQTTDSTREGLAAGADPTTVSGRDVMDKLFVLAGDGAVTFNELQQAVVATKPRGAGNRDARPVTAGVAIRKLVDEGKLQDQGGLISKT